MATSSAVLMLVFNRPSTTEMVFEAVRRAQPPRLYIAADGPRHGNVSDKIQCQQVRQIFEKIDWPCQLNTRYLERNLGCRMAVSSAISWFFEHEEEGIILEDDTLPTVVFLSFAMPCLSVTGTSSKFFLSVAVISQILGSIPEVITFLPDICVSGVGHRGDVHGKCMMRAYRIGHN